MRGVHSKKPMEQITQEELKRIMDVHVFGAYALTQAAVPYMKKAKGGSIIFISSMSACIGMTNVTAYSAAKSAVLGFTRTMAGELSGEGIRVNAIVPGFIDTPMFHQAVDLDPDRQAKIFGTYPYEEVWNTGGLLGGLPCILLKGIGICDRHHVNGGRGLFHRL